MEDITQEKLKELLQYNPDTGIFTYRYNIRRCRKGAIAGSPNKRSGHIQITISGKRYQAHRLAFLYMTGSFPVIILIEYLTIIDGIILDLPRILKTVKTVLIET